MCKSTELKSRSLFLKSATWRDRDLINAGGRSIRDRSRSKIRRASRFLIIHLMAVV